MRVVHLLRKYDPSEWGGTETAVQQLFEGLRKQGVTPLLYCPRVNGPPGNEPLSANGFAIKRFNACVPVWGISQREKQQFIAIGGNLMSFDLLPSLWREPDVALVHTHTLGRIGSIGSMVARARNLPLVVTIHGGVFDLPETVRNGFSRMRQGFDWGKFFGLLLRSRQLIAHADAVLACNPTEANLLQQRYPNKRIHVQAHGIPTAFHKEDHRAAAREAFPQIRNGRLILCVGRIDPVKNQGWLVEQAPDILRKHPEALFVLAGACTDHAYSRRLEEQIRRLGLATRIIFTGGLPPNDPRLIGLFQEAQILVLPSLSETFGLVILEAWATGTVVLSSRTSGALSLIKHGENGWLFNPAQPEDFHEALDNTISNPEIRAKLAATGRQIVDQQYNPTAVARQVKRLYEELIESKHALRAAA